MSPDQTFRRLFLVSCVLTCLLPAFARAEGPSLSARIDEVVQRANGPIASPTVSDAEFLRRVSLDLIGIPPTADEIRAFLADQDPQKREKAVDRLLAHPRYARHMAEVFDVMLMERRPPAYVTVDEWHGYLVKAFRENRPLNQLAREILSADGTDPNLRPAARFYLDRQSEPNLLTRDVGRIFFGRDMQCAQCHDHPLIPQYHQADYQGLFAFFSPGFAFTAPEPDKKTYYAERAGEDVAFESVFVKGEKHVTGPKLPGMPRIEEPVFYPGEEYEVKPADNVRPVPKFSRRAKLAELATSGSHRAFNENFANRLWAHMMGRGLVDPVDLHHPDNPPSNPELLTLLGQELANLQFDIKAFLRAIALTQTYQRSIDPPANILALAAQAPARQAELQSLLEQAKAAGQQAQAGYAQASEELKAAKQAADPVYQELTQAKAAAVAAVAKFAEVEKQLADVKAQLAAKSDVAQALQEAVTKAQQAAQKLPQDQELAQATQKFVERHQQMAAEVTNLTQAVAQKEAELKAPADAVTASRQALDAVRAKLSPLEANIRIIEQKVVAARQQTMDALAHRNRLAKELRAVEKLAGLKSLHETLVASLQAVAEADVAVRESHKAVEAQQATIVAQQQAQQAAEQQLAQAKATADAAMQENTRLQQAVEKVSQAAAQIQEASGLLANDAALAESARVLAFRADQLKISQPELAKKLADANAVVNQHEKTLADTRAALQAAITEMAQRTEKVSATELALQKAKETADTHQTAFSEAVRELEEHWTASCASMPLKPLTAEQICWSLLQCTGILDRYRVAEEAELNKTAALTEEDRKDPAKVAARELELEQRVYDKLKGNVGVFVNIYAAAAGQPQSDFFATADQALFTANGGYFNGWVTPAGGNVTERMIAHTDPKLAAEELYLSILGRLPNEQEVADVTAYLAARPQEKAACVQELAWGLATSAEFRFNH